MDLSADELEEIFRGEIVPRAFSPGCVVLSYLVSFIGAGCALELINKRTSPKGHVNFLLFVGAAVSMGGVSIWCMHFVGNRSLRLGNGQTELQIIYSSSYTALSFFMPIIVLLAAFIAVGTQRVVSWWRVVLGGLLAGSAICGMHYLGNASMYNYSCKYDIANVVGAAIIAVVANIVALAMFFVFRAAWANAAWKRMLSGMVLAGAVSGMHWCAAMGTQYRLIEAYRGSSGISRGATVIIVICLSLIACLAMAAMAALSVRTMKKYADKAQQVTLAAAIFDDDGRILVSTDGLLPSEPVTNTFVERGPNDTFGTAHPLFHWMFRASRNWAAVSGLLGGMPAHVGLSNRRGRLDVSLVDECGNLIDDYDLVMCELFCLAAKALADRTRQHITSVGILWDEILYTGDGGLRTNSPKHKRSRSVMARLEDLAERGLDRNAYGRGSLMFLVRHADGQDVARLEAAGYRFAGVDRVCGIIRSAMQIKTYDVRGKLQAMSRHAGEALRKQPGVRVGFFGIRARVGAVGFDVLVKRGARDSLPSEQMDTDRLERADLALIKEMSGLTVVEVLTRLAEMASTPFVVDFYRTLERLRSGIGDTTFETASLVPRVIALPGRSDDNFLIAFCTVVPIRVAVDSSSCEFIPLSFFKLQQLAAPASLHQLAFARAVHAELGPIIRAAQKGVKAPSTLTSTVLDAETVASPVCAGVESPGHSRTASPTPLTKPSSAPSIFSAKDDDDSDDNDDDVPYEYPIGALDSAPQVAVPCTAFGGIMVSQEINVNVKHASQLASTSPRASTLASPLLSRENSDSSQAGLAGHVRRPSAALTRAGGCSDCRGIEMKKVGKKSGEVEKNTEVKKGVDVKKSMDRGVVPTGWSAATKVAASVRSGSMRDSTTFVDELFAVCVGREFTISSEGG